MDKPLDESVCMSCYRRRWHWCGMGITLGGCLFFVGVLLLVPYRAATWNIGLGMMGISAAFIVMSVVLPFAAMFIRAKTKQQKHESTHSELPVMRETAEDTLAEIGDF